MASSVQSAARMTSGPSTTTRNASPVPWRASHVERADLARGVAATASSASGAKVRFLAIGHSQRLDH
jgi:hypothetical protein